MQSVAEKECIIFEVSAYIDTQESNEPKFSKKNETVVRLAVENQLL